MHESIILLVRNFNANSIRDYNFYINTLPESFAGKINQSILSMKFTNGSVLLVLRKTTIKSSL